MAKMSPTRLANLVSKVITTDPLSNEETSFAPYSAEAPGLCHIMATGDFSLHGGDEID